MTGGEIGPLHMGIPWPPSPYMGERIPVSRGVRDIPYTRCLQTHVCQAQFLSCQFEHFYEMFPEN